MSPALTRFRVSHVRPARAAAWLVWVVAAGMGIAACTPGQPPQPSHSQGRAARGAHTGSTALAENIAAQNLLPGDQHWRITRAGPRSRLEGYTDRTDVVPGVPFRLFVSTTARSFRVRAFRMGWYGGDGARLVWASPPVAGRSQSRAAIVQPGSMAVAAWRPSLTVPTRGWPPGSYLLRLDASSGLQRYVPMLIRSPVVTGRVVLVSPVTSYEAYNGWGGYSLYNGRDGTFATRSRRASFDRPYSYGHGASAYFAFEQPLVTLAERLGLPLAYLTGIDLQRDPHVLDGASAVISEGHDEYWSPAMRATLTRARNHGTNLAFLGANDIYRKIRFQASPLGPDRVEVNYKDPRQDPLYGTHNALVTGNWPAPPDPRPESSLIGQSYGCYIRANLPMIVTRPGSWVWAHTGVHTGQALPGMIGPEYDWISPAYPTPRPIKVFARSPVYCSGQLQYSNISYYAAHSGAGVLDTGTEDWVCSLPGGKCRQNPHHPPPALRRIIQTATANILKAFAHPRAGRTHRP